MTAIEGPDPMLTDAFSFSDPAFLKRCREVRRDLDDGVPMSLGDIAGALGMPFELFSVCHAAEYFRQAPDLGGVVVGGLVMETVH